MEKFEIEFKGKRLRAYLQDDSTYILIFVIWRDVSE